MSPSTRYKVVVFGEPGVGKTSFVDQFCYGKPFVIYNPDNYLLPHKISVGSQVSDLTLMDLSTDFLKPEHAAQPTEWAEKMLADAQGIVLLYDVTSSESFEALIHQAYKYIWGCRKLQVESDEDASRSEPESFGCVLVGNKLDLVAGRKESKAVNQNLAEDWAQSQGIRSLEIDSLDREGPESALQILVKNIKKVERLEERNRSTLEGHPKAKKNSIRDTLREALKSSHSPSGPTNSGNIQS